MTGWMIAGGLVLLFFGGELLVRGAVLLAHRLGVSCLMIGLTIVGFGTSTPELVTSLQAVMESAPGIAVGNIVGSNIANVLLIVGIAALICPIPCNQRIVLRDGGLMLAASLALLALSVGGVLDRVDGALLTFGLAGYLWYLWREETAGANATEASRTAAEQNMELPWPGRLHTSVELVLLAGGIVLTVLGGRLLVFGAIDLARSLEVSDTLIGLTIVAVGTSLPELATSVVAAYRRQPDIAYGNIVGSNVFNVLGIGGVTALTVPINVPDHVLAFDLPVMIAVTLLMAVFAMTGARLTRTEGAVLLCGYGTYIALISL
ncbi:MAG: calcium/sodium antiporter [Hyphomicrobiales bacterium]